MKAAYPKEEYLDFKRIFRLLRDKWWYFAVSLVVCLAVAYLYLKTTPRIYGVKASLQLKDQSINDQGVGSERFINGLELLSGNASLADEVGLLTSHSMVERAIEDLDFTVSYFRYPNSWGPLGKKMEEEIYQPGFRVLIDYDQPQLVGVPIHLSFPDEQHYRIQAEASEARLMDLRDQSLVQDKLSVDLDKTLPRHQPFDTTLLHFQLVIDSSFVIQEDQRFYVVLNSLESLTKSYADKLEIKPISEESNIVELKVEGYVPQKEKDFLNTLAEVYIQNDLRKKNQLGIRTIEFIDNQMATVYDSLQSVEGNLETFRSDNQIMDVSTTLKSLNEQLLELEAEQAQLEVHQRYYQHTSQYLRTNDNVTDVVAPSSVGINDPLLNNLLQNLAEMSQEKVTKSYSSGDNNPLLRVLESKIRNSKAALVENIDNLISSSRIALQENQRRINKLERQLSRLPKSERNLITIERKFELNDNIYNYLLQKRAEAGIAIASNVPNKSVVDPARADQQPSSPNPLMILLLAIVLGGALPVGIIAVQEFTKDVVQEKKELEEITELPVIGSINNIEQHYSGNGKYDQLVSSEAFKTIAINLNHFYNLKEKNIIGITSAQPADGKTFCSAYLANTMASSGRRTLAIDADLRRPRLHSYFNILGRGLSDYLAGEEDITNTIHTTRVEGLSVMPAGTAALNDPTFSFSKKNMGELISRLKNDFDVIIVDTPPINPISDFFVLSPLFQITLLVVRYNKTSRNLLEEITQRIERSKVENVNLIFNDVKNLANYSYAKRYYRSEVNGSIH